MPNITKKQRKEIEEKVYAFFDKLDLSGSNTRYYRELFGNMSDAKFVQFISKDFPFRFQYKPSVTEPSLTQIKNALKVINVPYLEKVNLNYLYKNKDGTAVESQECMTGYIPHKKVQQIVTKKSKWGFEIENRDGKTGRLVGADKGSAMSDREFEALGTMNLNNTMKEFYGPRADAMESKNAMYAIIGTTGMCRLSDLPDTVDESLSKNMLNSYLIAAHINSNLINQGDYTMRTIKEKSKKGLDRRS